MCTYVKDIPGSILGMKVYKKTEKWMVVIQSTTFSYHIENVKLPLGPRGIDGRPSTQAIEHFMDRLYPITVYRK